MKVVLDTNVLLVSISDRSKHHWIYDYLIRRKYEICISNQIITEYEEIIGRRWHPSVAKSVMRTLLELPNIHFMAVYFNLNLIPNDPDDNKFADCAFASNCKYIVTEDKHFNALNQILFPRIEVWNMEKFKQELYESPA